MMHHRQTSEPKLPMNVQLSAADIREVRALEEEVHGSIMRIAEIGLDRVTMNYAELYCAVDRAFARAGFQIPAITAITAI